MNWFRSTVSWTAAGALSLFVAVSSFAADLQSDDFSGGSLDSVWQIMNDQGGVSIDNGQLRIDASNSADVWANLDATLVYQETSDDFEIESNALVHYLDVSCVSGLVVFSETTQDHQGRDGQWVTLKLWGRGASEGNNAVLQYQRRENDDPALGYTGTHGAYNPAQGDIPISFRLRRVGDEYTSWFKEGGTGDWVEVGTVVNELANPVKVGMYAGIGDAAGGELTAWFDNFTEASDPVTAVEPEGKTAMTWGALKR